MKIVPKIAVFLGLILLITSFFLPAVVVDEGIELTGVMAFALNAGMLFYVESPGEYFEYVFLVLSNVWALYLFGRFWYRKRRVGVTVLTSLLAISSALAWLVLLENTSILAIGYWVWLLAFILLIAANLMKRNHA